MDLEVHPLTLSQNRTASQLAANLQNATIERKSPHVVGFSPHGGLFVNYVVVAFYDDSDVSREEMTFQSDGVTGHTR